MQKFLHVGCGMKNKSRTTKVFAGADWTEVRYDIDPSVNPDILGSMTNLDSIEDDSFDAIFSSHNIEHLYPHEVPIALAEFWRVLKPAGYFVVTCPDLQSVAKVVAEDKLTEPAYSSPAGPISALDILYGHRASLARNNLFMAHRCGFTKKVLVETLLESGFKTIASMARGYAPHFDLWALATKTAMSESELRLISSQHFPS